MPARICAAAAAVLLFVPVSTASAAWTNPFPVNSVNGDASSPSIGIDATGKAIVAYREAGGGLMLNTREPDGTIGTRVPLNDVPAGPPFIATNAASASAIVWQESDGVSSRLHLRLRRPNGAFTVNTTISQAGVDVFSPTVAVDGAGNAIAVWGANIGGFNRIFLRFKNATTGALGAIVPVSATTGNSQEPRIAMEPGGRAYVVWREFQIGGQVVMGRARSTSGTLSVPLGLSGESAVTGAADVAIDDSGTALVAWTKELDFTRAQARTRTAGGTLSPVTTLSSSGSAADSVDVAMAASGTTGVVGWRRPVGGDVRMQIRRLVGGAWQTTENVSPNGLDVNELRVGMPADGTTVTSLFSTSEDDGVLNRIRARFRRADGSLAPVDIVSSENGLPAQNPRLAINAAGQAAAAFRQQQDDARGDLIWVGANFLG